MMIYYGFAPPDVLAPKARYAVERALTLDDTLAEAHHARGIFKLFVDFDFDGLEKSFTRAMELNPTLAVVHAYYALALTITPRTDDLHRAVQRALDLDPISPLVGFLVAVAHYLAREYPEAVRHAQRVLALEPDHVMALWVCGVAFARMGRFDEGLALTGRVVDLTKRHAYFLEVHATALAEAGRLDDVRAIYTELRERATHTWVQQSVGLLVILEEPEEALALVERLLDGGHPGTALNLGRPELDGIRSEPRFARAVRRWLGDSPVAAKITEVPSPRR